MKFRDRVRAWLGVTTAPVVTPPPEMKINDLTVAEARAAGREAVVPWVAPRVPDFAPDPAGMAMDGANGAGSGLSISALYSWAVAGAFSEGLGFLGYPYLAELTQRPEYRRVSEIYAAEATRKGI